MYNQNAISYMRASFCAAFFCVMTVFAAEVRVEFPMGSAYHPGNWMPITVMIDSLPKGTFTAEVSLDQKFTARNKINIEIMQPVEIKFHIMPSQATVDIQFNLYDYKGSVIVKKTWENVITPLRPEQRLMVTTGRIRSVGENMRRESVKRLSDNMIDYENVDLLYIQSNEVNPLAQIAIASWVSRGGVLAINCEFQAFWDTLNRMNLNYGPKRRLPGSPNKPEANDPMFTQVGKGYVIEAANLSYGGNWVWQAAQTLLMKRPQTDRRIQPDLLNSLKIQKKIPYPKYVGIGIFMIVSIVCIALMGKANPAKIYYISLSLIIFAVFWCIYHPPVLFTSKLIRIVKHETAFLEKQTWNAMIPVIGNSVRVSGHAYPIAAAHGELSRWNIVWEDGVLSWTPVYKGVVQLAMLPVKIENGSPYPITIWSERDGIRVHGATIPVQMNSVGVRYAGQYGILDKYNGGACFAEYGEVDELVKWALRHDGIAGFVDDEIHVFRSFRGIKE